MASEIALSLDAGKRREHGRPAERAARPAGSAGPQRSPGAALGDGRRRRLIAALSPRPGVAGGVVVAYCLPRRRTSSPPASWGFLLDPVLRDSLMLASSLRVVIALAERLPNDLDDLPHLRRQASSYDDRNGPQPAACRRGGGGGLQARWAVPLLRSDPRLHAMLPDQGAVLGWTVLVRPASSPEPLPQPWVDLAAWGQPLLSHLARQGWWAGGVAPFLWTVTFFGRRLRPFLRRWPR